MYNDVLTSVSSFVRPSAKIVERNFKNVIWHLQFYQPNANTNDVLLTLSHFEFVADDDAENPFDDDGVKIHE